MSVSAYVHCYFGMTKNVISYVTMMPKFNTDQEKVGEMTSKRKIIDDEYQNDTNNIATE